MHTEASTADRAPWQVASAAPPARGDSGLPPGVGVLRLRDHADERGVFTELFRNEWALGAAPVQWNAVRSAAGVLRGVHVHPRHDDYLTVVFGRASIGLRDLRPGAEAEGSGCVVALDAREPTAILIPHGVAHGFLFHVDSIHVYAVSHTWDPADELGCRWDDPDLAIPWPNAPTLVSERDASLPTLAELRSLLDASRVSD